MVKVVVSLGRRELSIASVGVSSPFMCRGVGPITEGEESEREVAVSLPLDRSIDRSMSSNEEKVDQVAGITGSSTENARAALEGSGWSVEAAVLALLRGEKPHTTSRPPASTPPSKPHAKGRTTGLVTLRDYQQASADLGEDDRQDYFTGGERSGLVVTDPQGKKEGHDVTRGIFDAARRQGAREEKDDDDDDDDDDDGDDGKNGNSFAGTGYRLGNDATSQSVAMPRAPKKTPITRTLAFYKDGFTVDGTGPLRRLDDPANMEFLRDVERGVVPKELDDVSGRPVHVQLEDHRDQDYCPPPEPKYIAFAGEGHRLGSSTHASPPPESQSQPRPSKGHEIDETKPVTSIQIRLHNGTRLVCKFNLSHTVADLRAFIDAATCGPPRAYEIRTTFPSRSLVDLSQTVEQAQLQNSVVVQKFL